MKNYYEILQLDRDADAHQIRLAYRKLSMQYHPDRHGGRRKYEEQFKQINEAYQVLRDPIKRWQYRQDMQRRASGSRPCGNWSTPDYAAQAHKYKGQGPQRARSSFRAPFQPYRRAKVGLGNTLWSIALVLVLIMPFKWAAQAPLAAIEEESRLTNAYAQTVAYDLAEIVEERYYREVRLLHEIRQIDPGLRHLDMRTGYYETSNSSFRFSWEALQLIREKNWKRQ